MDKVSDYKLSFVCILEMNLIDKLITNRRVLEDKSSDFASEFHLYRLEWLLDRIEFYIDDQLTGEVAPPIKGGFWEYGVFPGENIWTRGTIMAPFDRLVFKISCVNLS